MSCRTRTPTPAQVHGFIMREPEEKKKPLRHPIRTVEQIAFACELKENLREDILCIALIP